MEYLTPKQVAEKWGVSLRTVHSYCANHKIAGVIRSGKHYLIPKMAKRPADMRRKSAKAVIDIEDYHFPVLVFSRFYVDRDELSEDECALLDAQILYLKEEWAESIQLCRQLIEKSPSESVRFGACWTNTLSYQHLGLPYETINSMNAMEKICKNNSAHYEDYRMMMAYCSVMQTFESKDYFSIDPSKLCEDALLFYGCIALWIADFHSSSESPYAMAVYSGLCQQIDLLGIHPINCFVHGCLGTLFSYIGDEQRQMQHIREACKIGHDFGFITLMSQLSSIAVGAFYQSMCLFGKDYAKKIEKNRSQDQKNNIIVTTFIRGELKILEGCSPSEFEIMILLAAQKTNKAIAGLKNISEKAVREHIKNICKRCGLGTKKELVYYCRELLGNLSREISHQCLIECKK